MRILVDMDGICADLLDIWISTYNQLYNQEVKVEDIKDWDIHKFVPDGAEIYKILGIPDLYKRIPLIDGAREGIKTLMDAGHQVVICSAAHAHENVASEKMYWLREHLPFISSKNITFAYHKYWMKADAMIDDSGANLKKYQENWPNALTYGITWPCNHEAKEFATLMADDYRNTRQAWEAIVTDILRRHPNP